MNKNFIVGGILLLGSGLLYTIERFYAIFIWASEMMPVKFRGTGEYPATPLTPTLFDNLFVPLFLIIGSILLLIGVIQSFKK